MNFTSLSEMMDFGKPCNLTISEKNKCATCVASLVFLHGMKCAILVKRSTTTMMESNPRCLFDKPKTNSKLTKSHGLFEMGKGVYNPSF